jgi:hypothetical protein
MSRDFSLLLKRQIPRLDHEVVVMRAIERTLKSQKLDWRDVAKTAQSPPSQWSYEPSRTESDAAHRMRAWLTAISREDWLNAWTAGFVSDLLLRPSLDGLTGKQTACVNRIIRQAQDRGVRADRRAA